MNITKRGSLIVDAAMTVPFFVVGLALLLAITIQIGSEERTVRGMTSSAISAVDAAALAGKSDDFFLSGNLSFRAAWALYQAEYDGEMSSEGFPRFYTGLEVPLPCDVRVDNVVFARITVKTGLHFIDDYSGLLKSTQTLAFRPFCGESQLDSEEVNDNRVYVFPKNGSRYHREGCFILQDGCVETILTSSLRKKYKPCSICDPQTFPNGSKVYMFLETSGTYHRKNCACITKTYVSMPESQAISQGYTPCHFCGGDN